MKTDYWCGEFVHRIKEQICGASKRTETPSSAEDLQIEQNHCLNLIFKVIFKISKGGRKRERELTHHTSWPNRMRTAQKCKRGLTSELAHLAAKVTDQQRTEPRNWREGRPINGERFLSTK